MTTDGSDEAGPARGVPAAGRGGVPPRPSSTYRTPRYSVFLATGALVGLLAGLWLGTYGAAPTATGGSGALGYLAAIGTLFGALLGGTVALAAEWLMNRRLKKRRGKEDRPGGRGRARRR